MRRWLVAGPLILALASCGTAAEVPLRAADDPPVERVPPPTAAASARPTPAPPSPPAPPAPVDVPAEPPASVAGPVEVAFAPRPGVAPCTMTVDGSRERGLAAGAVAVTHITRLAVAGGGCSAQELWNAQRPDPPSPDDDDGALDGGYLLGPGQEAVDGDLPVGLRFEDLDRDGDLDLIVARKVGMRATGSVHWRWNAAARRFVRAKDLDPYR